MVAEQTDEREPEQAGLTRFARRRLSPAAFSLSFGGNMNHVSEDLRGAVVGFVVLLSKGLLDDERWEWDIELFDWNDYQAGFTDPTILKTAMAVFMNNLKVDEAGQVINYHDARFRAFQYFRALVDPSYPFATVSPPFAASEIEEPDWLIWEG